jgi:hypothetical protein
MKIPERRKARTLIQPKFQRIQGKNAYVMIADAGYISPTHRCNRLGDDILATHARSNFACIHRISIHIVGFAHAN